MTFHPLPVPGLILLRPILPSDSRGFLVKTYQQDLFLENGIDFVPKEEFYTVSHFGVVRGMHFQAPPAEYGKLVHCVHGRVLDVVLDLRRGSPMFGRTWSGELDSIRRETLYLPPGLAHGFCSLAPETLVSYSTSHVHDSRQDLGIRWDTFGYAWPCAEPILSSRDRTLPSFQGFTTPFSYP
jgi:dTDP-4-dehydrorhamnose 3,5-epimerase